MDEKTGQASLDNGKSQTHSLMAVMDEPSDGAITDTPLTKKDEMKEKGEWRRGSEASTDGTPER